MVDGILCSIERLYLRHPELCWKREVYLGCERGLSLLHQGVHRVWSSALYDFLNVADLLLDALEPLLPRSLPHSLLRRGWFIVSDVPPECCLVELFSGGQVRLVPPGSTGFCFYSCLSERAEVLLLSLRGGVMAFLGLLHFLRALHLPGELL